MKFISTGLAALSAILYPIFTKSLLNCSKISLPVLNVFPSIVTCGRE